MTSGQLAAPRLPPGSLVVTPEMSFRLSKAGVDLASFGAYHAAQDTRFRDFSTGSYGSSSRPESDYFPKWDRAKVIARARVMFRNNPYLAATLLAYVMEMGTPTLRSQTGDDLYDDAKERLFERWAQDCEVDEDLSLDEVVEIWHFEEAIAGEMFGIKRREGWLQLIASELCGSAQKAKRIIPAGAKFADGLPLPAGAHECDGIVRDAANFIIGYRFGRRDDLGCISFADERSSIVRKEYVFHFCSRQRTEQSRGVPLLVAILNAMQDLFETAHARAQQVKNASCLSLWITKNIDPYGFAEAMRGSLRGGDLLNVPALKEIATSRSAHQEVKAGAVMYGAAGETLQVVEPKLNAADFHDHYIDLAQICCACLNGMPVEVGFEGFRDSSYSSARATMNKWKRNVLRGRRRLERKFLHPLQLWISTRAHIFGDLDPAPKAKDSFSHNTDENVRWGWPAIPEIDEAKTAATNAIELANGTTSLDAIYAAKGEYAPDETKRIAKERARFLKDLIAAGVEAGLEPAEAKAWALSQGNAAGQLAPVIAAVLAPSPEKKPDPAPTKGDE